MIEVMNSGAQSPIGFVANEIFADTDGIYLAVAAPRRIEILLLNENGNIKEYYYRNLESAIGCSGLIVKKTPRGKRFFILRMYPQDCIEELRPGRD